MTPIKTSEDLTGWPRQWASWDIITEPSQIYMYIVYVQYVCMPQPRTEDPGLHQGPVFSLPL